MRGIIAVNQGRKPLYQGIINALELPVKFKTEKSLFWNKYFANKAVAEDFKVLAESDPQKAQEFYNKNKTKIDDFMAQKVTASAYYDAKSSVDALKKSGADPEIIREAEKSMNNVFKPKNGEPTQMIDGNNAGDTYARMYGFDTYLKEVPQDELELKKYASEVLKDARGVYSNKYIPEDLKSGMIEKMGLDPREVEIDVISGKTVVDRALWAREYLAGVPEEQRAKALSDLINYKTLSGKRIMTKDVAKELGLEGAYNSFYIKQSSSGRPGGKVTLRKVSPEKVSEPIEVGKMPEIKPISISEMLSKTPDYTASKSAISESELSKLRKPIKA